MTHTRPTDAYDWRTPGIALGVLPAEICGLLDAFVAAGHGSAVALAVVRCRPEGDDVAFAHVVGRTSAARRRDDADNFAGAAAAEQANSGQVVDADTYFDLASLTKPIVTTSLLCGGITRGDFGLDDPVVLEGLDVESSTAMTLASLLGHGSGWPAWADFYAATATLATAPLARMRAIRRAVLATPFERPPEQVAVYSDLGFMALGWWLEARAGVALDQLFNAEFVAPGHLHGLAFRRIHPEQVSEDTGLAVVAPRNCAVVATEIWPARCEAGHPLQGVVHDDNAAGLLGVAGHAGLFGNLRGVAGFAASWLAAVGDGTRRLGRVGLGGALSPDLAATLLARSAAPGTTWRLGWDTPSKPKSTAGSLASARAFGHLGFVGTSVWIDPTRDAAVVLLTNRVHPTRTATAPIAALRPAVHDAVWRWIDGAQPLRQRVAISSSRS